MTRVVTAPEPFDSSGFKVYLGGAIDMGEAVNWQVNVINSLKDYQNLVLFNPRRVRFTQDTEDEQITWELRAMDTADIILMWFPKEAEAPISFLETGLYLTSGKLILGAEEGFFRRRNLELTAQYYSMRLWGNITELTTEMIRRYSQHMQR